MKKRALAFVLSLSLVAALQPSLVASAAEPAECTTTVVIESNDVKSPTNPGNYGITDNGNSVSIEGSKITVEGEGDGVSEKSSNVAITNSNITTKQGDGVFADGGNITINKSAIVFGGNGYTSAPAGLNLAGGSKGTVNDSSVSTANAKDDYNLFPITVHQNSTATINNCKIVTDTDASIGVYVAGNSTAIINKSEIKNTGKAVKDGDFITGGDAVFVRGNGSNVIVNDSTITGETGVCVEGDSSNLVILNNTTVTATGTKEDYNNAALWINLTGDTSSVPTIFVDKLEATNGADLILAFDKDDNDVSDQVANQVYYIINTEKLDNGTITVSKAANVTEVKDADGNVYKDKNGNTLYAASRSNTVTINIAAASGYEVKSVDGGKATLTKNADGSYTLTIPEGGGVDISAVIQAIAVSGGMTTEDICAGIANGYQAMLNAAKLSAVNTADAVNAVNVANAANAVNAVNLTSSAGLNQLHVFIGGDDAITFDDSQDLSNYQAINFEHADTVNGNTKTINFTNKQALGTKATFHTVVSKPASWVKVYKMENGTKKLVTKVVSDSNGCVCFPISETAEYVLEY